MTIFRYAQTIIYNLTFFFCATQCVYSQSTLKGSVIDSSSQLPISNAIIYTVDKDSNTILSYNFCNTEGVFEIDIMLIKYPLILKINKLGYKSQLYFYENRIKIPLNPIFQLMEDTILIKEVMILGRSKIKEKKDTTIFDVEQYRDSTERNLEQLLGKIPGVEVDRHTGEITFKGKQIKRILVEGDDISGSDYRIVSRTVDPALLETIQIIDKFESNELLKHTVSSDEQVINITLKKQFKFSTSGEIGVGFGTSNQHSHAAKLLSFSPNIKFLNNYEYNTIGIASENILKNNLNLLPRTPNQSINPLTSKSDIKRFFNDLNLNTLPIGSELYYFNKTGLGVLNYSIKKMPQLKLTGSLSYSLDNINSEQNQFSIYRLIDSIFRLKEFEKTTTTLHRFSTSLSAEYNLNKHSQISYQGYYNNTTINNSQQNQVNNFKTNIQQPFTNYILKNELNHIQKINNRITIINSVLSLNQQINESIFIDEFSNRLWPFTQTNFGLISQSALSNRIDRQFSSSAYFGSDSMRLSCTLGFAYSNQKIASRILLYDKSHQLITTKDTAISNFALIGNDFFSQFKWQKKWVNADFFAEIRLGNFFSKNTNFLHFYQFYGLPQIGFSKKFGKAVMTSSYAYDLTLPKFNNIVENIYFLKNYRNIEIGTPEQNPYRSHKFVFNYTKTNLARGYNYFLNLTSNLSNGGYQTFTTIENDFTNTTLLTNKYPNWRLFLNLGGDKFIDKLASRVFIKPYLSFSNSQNNLSGYGQRTFNTFNYGGDIEIRSGFLGFFNFNVELNTGYRKIIFKKEGINSNLDLITNNLFSSLSFKVTEGLRLEFQNEAILINDNQNSKATTFGYSHLSFYLNPKNKKWDIMFKVHNLLNTKQWVYSQVNDLTFVETTTSLIPRYLLIKFSYKFNSAKSNL
jgi:hypothetical protein